MEPRLISLLGHLHGVRALAFSPDNRILATAGGDGTVQLWKLPQGEPLQRFVVEGDGPGELVFSPDGRHLAIAGDPIHVWDLHNNRVTLLPVSSWGPLAFTAEGAALLITGSNGFQVVELSSGQILRQIPDGWPVEDRSDIIATALSLDGTVGAVGAYGSRSGRDKIWIWDLQTGELRRRRRVPKSLWWRERDPRTGKMRTIHGAAGSVDLLAFSPLGEILAVGGNGTLWLCDVASGRNLRLLLCGGEEICDLAFSADGTTLVATDTDDTLRAWRMNRSRPCFSVKVHQAHAFCVACASDGSLVADARSLALRQTSSGTRTLQLPGLGYVATEVLYARDGSWIRVGYSNGTVRRWNSNSGAVERLLRHHQLRGNYGFPAPVRSPDGVLEAKPGPGEPWRVGVAPGDETVELFQRASVDIHQVETGDLVRRLACDCSTYLAFSTDSTLLLAAQMKWHVEVWSVETGTRIEHVDLYNGSITAIACSPDNRLLAAAGRGGPLPTRWEEECSADIVYEPSITLWDRDSSAEIARFRSIAMHTYALCFSPCGRRLASVGNDAALRIWEVPTGRLVATMHPLPCGEGGDDGWIVFTPEQFYDVSPGAEDCFGWLTGTQLHPPAEYADRYHRPDLVAAALSGKSLC